MKETTAGRWRGEAPDDDTQIDGFDALAMAVHMASQPEEDDVPDINALTRFPS
jgi:phage terminase large subunit-like protein